MQKSLIKTIILVFMFFILGGHSSTFVAAPTTEAITKDSSSVESSKLYPHAQKLHRSRVDTEDHKQPISLQTPNREDSNQRQFHMDSQSFAFDSLGFYDALDYDPYSNDINFQDTFNSSETTFINWELWLCRLPGSPPFSQTIRIDDIWYNSDNEVVFEDSQNMIFRSGRQYDWAFNGCGYNETGMWAAGEYRVEIYANAQLIGESSFQVIDDSVSPVPIDGQTLQLDFFGFYDSTLYDPDSFNIDYQEQFPLSTTGTINWEMWLSRSDESQDFEFTVEEDWYDPQGNNICHREEPTIIDAGWDQAYYYDGYTPDGSWDAGEYRVEIKIDDQLINAAVFEIVNDLDLLIPVQSICLNESELFLVAGQQESLTAVIKPSNASKQNISWKSTGPEIASVDQNGLVSALQEGTATIIAADEDEQHVARCEVYVSAAEVASETAVYRALLVANADYPGSDSDLEGPSIDVERIGQVLSKCRFGTEATYFASIKKGSNLSYDQLEAQIKECFADAKSNDVSYFYYSGHGYRESGESGSYLCTVDEDYNYMSVNDLEKLLSAIPGQKVVLLDCCFSGAMINRSLSSLESESALELFNADVIAQFKQTDNQSRALLNSSPYKVLTASSGNETASEGLYGGLYGGEFTTALVRGCGYESVTYPADTNSDKEISLNEAYIYSKAKVHESHVQVYPEGDSTFSLIAYNEPVATSVTSIQLNKERLSLKVAQSETLTATILPSTASDKTISWASSNTAVATVSEDGTVHALTPGTASITATSSDGNKSASCQLVVSKAEAEAVSNWNGPSEPVEENKTWTIKFSQAIDTNTLLEKNIFVSDENGSIVTQKYYIDRTAGGKLVTLTPENPYTNGSTYYLNIQNVVSQTGQLLKENVRMPFTIRTLTVD